MNKVILVTLAMMVSAFASADPADVNLSKSSLTVDFNQMIDGNNTMKKDIQKNIEQQLGETDIDEVDDKSRVLDFVDVEVGWGDSPNAIVDRRFDSISNPQPIDLNALVPKYL